MAEQSVHQAERHQRPDLPAPGPDRAEPGHRLGQERRAPCAGPRRRAPPRPRCGPCTRAPADRRAARPGHGPRPDPSARAGRLCSTPSQACTRSARTRARPSSLSLARARPSQCLRLAEIPLDEPVVLQIGDQPLGRLAVLLGGEAVLQRGPEVGVLAAEPADRQRPGPGRTSSGRCGRPARRTSLGAGAAGCPARRCPAASPRRTRGSSPASGTWSGRPARPARLSICLRARPPGRRPRPARYRRRCTPPPRHPARSRPRTPRAGPRGCVRPGSRVRSSSRSAPAGSAGGAARCGFRWSAAGTGR